MILLNTKDPLSNTFTICIGSLTWSLLDIFEDFTRNTNLLKGEIPSMHLFDCSGQEFTAVLSFFVHKRSFYENINLSKMCQETLLFPFPCKKLLKPSQTWKNWQHRSFQGGEWRFVFVQFSAKKFAHTHLGLAIPSPGKSCIRHCFPIDFEQFGFSVVFNGTWYKHMHARIMLMCMHASRINKLTTKGMGTWMVSEEGVLCSPDWLPLFSMMMHVLHACFSSWPS